MLETAVLMLGCSFLLAIIFTPVVAFLSKEFGLLDRPTSRKVHTLAIPRIGGLAIFVAFALAIIASIAFSDSFRVLVRNSHEIYYLFAGGIVAFLLGFFDDVKRLGPRVKFGVQIIAASAAYLGGIKITSISLPIIQTIQLEWMSLPVTVFWIILVINAINLIDGLDGLAAGVCFFVCLVLLSVMVIHQNFLMALTLSCLAGSILGFLFYNFNPASIFMGDSGSYFLGYMLATLSVFGSFKSHTTLTFIIPVIALGVPLMDTIWATIRRFLFGQRLFFPDKNHFHHRLLKLGYTHRRAVLVLYSITIALGLFSLFAVNLSENLLPYLLGLLILAIIIFIQRLGYLNFLGLHSVFIWLFEVINTLGINKGRRIFLSHQMAITESENLQEFWQHVVNAANYLGLDYIEMQLGGRDANFKPNEFVWHSLTGGKTTEELYSNHRLYMRFPLKHGEQYYGLLKVSKKQFTSFIEHSQTLKRLELLRRSLSEALFNFKENPVFEMQDRRKNRNNKDAAYNGAHDRRRSVDKNVTSENIQSLPSSNTQPAANAGPGNFDKNFVAQSSNIDGVASSL